MKTEFKFSNLLGTVYRKGDLNFTPDGSCLLSPVGNRVTVFDLINNKSYTLPFSHRCNINRVALSPLGKILISIDEDGRAILTNLPRRITLHHFSFGGPTSALAFSPTGQYIAVSIGRLVEVWHTPKSPESAADKGLDFAPLVRHRTYAGHHGDISHITWSSDSRFFLTAGKDQIVRIWSLVPEQDFVPTTLTGHRESVLGAWFSDDQERIFTISQDGALFEWGFMSNAFDASDPEHESAEREQPQWRIKQRHFFMQNKARVTSATFHSGSRLLVVGFSNGLFRLYELPDFNLIHELSVSQNAIDSITINSSAEWLALGASKLGQVLVWEWQSESYVLKQQGHFDSVTDVVYSPDGTRLVTTADDGKVKVWDSQSGFCTMTFTEHSSCVTACQFAKRGQVLFTSSLDGSVRAWDLVRYRNFRTFSSTTRLSFSCLAVDPSGEVVCAGSEDSFDIHIWSVQTGQLLDQLSGHEGPISSLAFAPSGDTIASGSWDHTVRLWSIFGRSQTSEPLQLQADVLHVSFRADSRQVAVSTLDGQLTFWAVSEGTQMATLDGRHDVSGGRKISDRRIAANVAGTKSFTCLAYSADGSCVIAGGNSKYICLYDVRSGVLLKKFVVSVNLSLDGTQEFLNSRNLTEAGPRDLLDNEGEASDLEDRIDRTLPGASRGDASQRRIRPEVRVQALCFSPVGGAFCAASTEGLLVFALDNALQFDPFDLDLDVTPAAVVGAILRGDFLRAMILAFRLNERSLMRRVYEATPLTDVALVVSSLPTVYLSALMRLIVQMINDSANLELNLRWVETVLTRHGPYLKESSHGYSSELRSLQQLLDRTQKQLTWVAEENSHVLEYLSSRTGFAGKPWSGMTEPHLSSRTIK